MGRKYIKFADYLVDELRNPAEATAFRAAALSDYEEDNDSAALMLAVRYLVEAQGSVPKPSKKVKVDTYTA